jgi:hypothetical protein
MEPMDDDDERAARNRKWRSAYQRLLKRFDALGLVYGPDYFLFGEDWLQHGTGIGVPDENAVTADFLAACSRALSEEGEWAALVAVYDSTRKNKQRWIVEIIGDGFALLAGSDVTRQAMFEAYRKLALGHLLPSKQ